jgi:hypothetical protein
MILEDDNPIFGQPYRFNEVEKALVQAWIIWEATAINKVLTKLLWEWNYPKINSTMLDDGLVELSRSEYALTTMMQIKKTFYKLD